MSWDSIDRDRIGRDRGREPRRGGRDPLGDLLGDWLGWLTDARPPKPWCGSVPSQDGPAAKVPPPRRCL
jgi:hypothetical protein